MFCLVMYFFVGFQTSATKFFIFWACLCMFQIISEGVGMCCAVVTRQVRRRSTQAGGGALS